MESNRELVAAAFQAWMDGNGDIPSLWARDMTWQMMGQSVVSRVYGSAQEFLEELWQPFGQRFGTEDPFRPVGIRALYDDEDHDAVIVVWDGRGTTTARTVYQNTYAWFLTFRDGKISRGMAFFDSITYNQLWSIPVG